MKSKPFENITKWKFDTHVDIFRSQDTYMYDQNLIHTVAAALVPTIFL